jgi:predicted outer membrane repeat protein
MYRISRYFILFILILISHIEAGIIYVDASASAEGDGSSWESALNSLDAALEKADKSEGASKIQILAGVYKPTVIPSIYSSAAENLKTFYMPDKVELEGGFYKKGNKVLQDPKNHPTILSGDLAGNDPELSDNAWHVITAIGVTVNLKNLIIEKGYAYGPDSATLDERLNLVSIDYAHSKGGGIYALNGAKVKINQVILRDNVADPSNTTVVNLLGIPLLSGGAGIAAFDPETSIIVRNSTLQNNKAFNGGAVSILFEARLQVINSIIKDNFASRAGGGIRAKNAEVLVINSLFENNAVESVLVDEAGGAISATNSNLHVSKSQFLSNRSAIGGGAILFHSLFQGETNEDSTLNIDKSYFYNNFTGLAGGGAINIFTTLPNEGVKAVIKNSLFESNFGGIGGAILVDSINASIQNSKFKSNNSLSWGGALSVINFNNGLFGVSTFEEKPTVDVKNNHFESNLTLGNGSFVLFIYNLLASRVPPAFGFPAGAVDSEGSYGGGAVASLMGGKAFLVNNTFLYNSAIGSGGAISAGGVTGTPIGLGYGYVSIKDAYYEGNSASVSGDNTAVMDPGGFGESKDGVIIEE